MGYTPCPEDGAFRSMMTLYLRVIRSLAMIDPLHNNHRGATETLVAACRSRLDAPSGHTTIGIDECVYRRAVLEAVRALLDPQFLTGAFPMWQENRKLDSGETINGITDQGTRLPGDSWPDDHVAAFAIGYLYSHRRVIVLTADRAGNLDGLRPLLHRNVAPVLNRDLSHGRSLIVLLQRPKTTIEGYATRLRELVPQLTLEPGFNEIKV